jgi:hypothetical protein
MLALNADSILTYNNDTLPLDTLAEEAGKTTNGT